MVILELGQKKVLNLCSSYIMLCNMYYVLWISELHKLLFQYRKDEMLSKWKVRANEIFIDLGNNIQLKG